MSSATRTGPASPTRGVTRTAALEAVSGLQQTLMGLGIDSSVPNQGHTGSKVRLPLQYFDSTDRERNTPLGWVDLSIRKFGKRANAAVLVADEAGIGMWRLGRVFRYDAKSSSFYVHLCSDFGQLLDDSALSLPRLSVMFLAESVDEFALRVAAAHRARDETEAALLFRFYVTNMPTTDMRTLNELQVPRAAPSSPAHAAPAARFQRRSRYIFQRPRCTPLLTLTPHPHPAP